MPPPVAVAVMFMGVSGYLDDPADAGKVVTDVLAALPSGSYRCPRTVATSAATPADQPSRPAL